MSCDLSDPNISVAYNEIISGQPTNWLILGYHDTRDVISLYKKGSGGLSELRSNLSEEVLFGFLRLEDRYVLISYISEQVSGVRRARALVHGRAVAVLFKAHDTQITASNANDLSDVTIRNRLKIGVESAPSASPTVSTAPPTASPAATPTVELPSPSTPKSKEDTEKKAREEFERQQREAERRQKEAIERQYREKYAAELKAKEEAEKKAKEAKDEAERIQKEKLRRQYLEVEKTGKAILSGFITVQGGGSPFWKRRWFTLRGRTLHLYRDEADKLPIANLDLNGTIRAIEDAQLEVLIPNSFRVDFVNNESYYFFSDTKQDTRAAMSAFARASQI